MGLIMAFLDGLSETKLVASDLDSSIAGSSIV